jgi:hypothetical protein
VLDLDAGAGSGLGRLDKVELEKRSEKRKGYAGGGPVSAEIGVVPPVRSSKW